MKIMKNHNIILLIIAIFLSACITKNQKVNDNDSPPDSYRDIETAYFGFDIKVTDLGDGLFQLRTDRSGNVGVLVGSDGVFMIDTQMEHLVKKIDSTQKELSGHRDVELVLNTHLHRDHVRGNAYFADKGAQIMAHPNVRKYLESSRAIVALKREAPEVKPAYLPSIGVSTGTTVSMNGQTGYIYHTPNAHTDGDIFIHFKEANVIHAGDLLFSGRFPFIDIDNGGSVAGYIAGMEKILEIADQNTRIIAGHGPISSEIHLEDNIKMLNETHEIIKAHVDKGMSLKEIKQLNPLKDFTATWEWAFITTDLMVQTHYYELTGRLE
jgi:glyoxylase-like metal-dependent hydrolase (beta-lactamase superfamily II)